MAREFCLFVLEGGSGTTPWGTPVTPAAAANIWDTTATTGIPSTAAGAGNYSAFYARLDGSDSFTMRPRPVMVTVPYGGGVAIPAFTVSDKQILEGTYKTKLYAGAFTQMLLQLACQQVNSLGYVGLSGVSSGWQYGPAAGSTGSQAGNLPSVSIFHAIQRADDASYKCRLYTGVRVKSWQFTLSENSMLGDLTLHLTGGYASGNPFTYKNSVDPTLQTFATPATPPVFNTTTTPSTWCAPSTKNFPVTPFLFTHVTPVTIGITRSTFQSIGMSCTNKLMTRFWNNRFVQYQQFCGRDLTVTAQNFYTNMSPEDRLEYENTVAQSVSIELNDGASHTIIFTMNANNIIKTLEDSLPLDDIYTQTMTVTSQFDPAFSQTDQLLAADFQMAFTE